MRQFLLTLAISFAAAGQNVIDRVAVIVGNQVITASEVILEARLTAFFNGQPLDLSAGQRKAAAERLVDQQLIRSEMQVGGYRLPAEAEGDAVVRKFRQDNYSSIPAYRAALAKYDLTEDDVKRHLLWQAAALNFTDQRFHVTSPEPPTQSADRLSAEALAGSAGEDQMDVWLKQVRAGTRIQFKKEAFQ
jgi:parvulin-like peptidyl-prolyl isomerase